MGVDEVSAAQFTSDLIDDIQSATHYAVPSTPLMDVESLTQTVNALVSGIGVVKDQHVENEASE